VKKAAASGFAAFFAPADKKEGRIVLVPRALCQFIHGTKNPCAAWSNCSCRQPAIAAMLAG
jgi:hypothetical protein